MESCKRIVAVLLMAAAGSIGLAGCGGSDGANLSCGEGTTEKGGECVVDSSSGKCGENTTEMNGQCVPDLQSICSSKAGAVTAKDGNCVIAEGACNEGTKLAADTGQCIPSEKACGNGLALDSDNQCAPTEEVCGEGATFQDGICVPELECQQGDVVLNGKCVPEAEKLAQNPDVTESENNDPENGGTANSIPVKPPGDDSLTSFKGSIRAPQDIDGDGEPEQDADTFAFDGEAGQWFEIRIRSLGLPVPLAIVTGPNDYQRISPIGVQQDTVRQIALPYDGEYQVTVLPTLQAVAGRTVGAGGSKDQWQYVGVLEQLEAPSGSEVQLTSSPASGDVQKLTDNFYKVTEFKANGLAELTVESLGSSARQGALQIWKDESTPVSEFGISDGATNAVPVPSSGEFYVLVDAGLLTGVESDYELSGAEISNVQAVGQLETGTKTTSPVDIAAGDTGYFQFEIPAGSFLEVRQQNSGNATIVTNIFERNGPVARGTTNLDDFQNPQSRFPTTHVYYYADSKQTLLMKAAATEDATPLNSLRLRLRTGSPSSLGSGGPGDTISQTFSAAIEDGKSTLHTFTVDAQASAEITVTPNNSETFIAALYDAEYNLRTNAVGRSGAADLGTRVLEPGTYVVRVEAIGEELSGHAVDVALTSP